MSDYISSSDGPKCPYCGCVHSESEDWMDVVTFWGSENGPLDFDCHSCGLIFSVVEHVSREWDSHPIVQQKICQTS